MATTSPVTQQEGTPIHVLRTHLSVCFCVWVLGNICPLRICQRVFADPAVEPSIVHFAVIRTHSSSSDLFLCRINNRAVWAFNFTHSSVVVIVVMTIISRVRREPNEKQPKDGF